MQADAEPYGPMPSIFIAVWGSSLEMPMIKIPLLTDLDAARLGIPLISMQSTGVASPSIHAGFRLVPTGNVHEINQLLTGPSGPFPASTDMPIAAGAWRRGGAVSLRKAESRPPDDPRLSPAGPRGMNSLAPPCEPLSKENGYAVRHCESESDWSAAVGMSRCA